MWVIKALHLSSSYIFCVAFICHGFHSETIAVIKPRTIGHEKRIGSKRGHGGKPKFCLHLLVKWVAFLHTLAIAVNILLKSSDPLCIYVEY
jgi:hypothetical protein